MIESRESHDGHNEAMMGRGPAPGADRTRRVAGAPTPAGLEVVDG